MSCVKSPGELCDKAGAHDKARRKSSKKALVATYFTCKTPAKENISASLPLVEIIRCIGELEISELSMAFGSNQTSSGQSG